MSFRIYIALAVTLAIFAMAVQAYPSLLNEENPETESLSSYLIRDKRAPVPQFYGERGYRGGERGYGYGRRDERYGSGFGGRGFNGRREEFGGRREGFGRGRY